MTATFMAALDGLQVRHTLALSFGSEATCFITQNQNYWLVQHHQGTEMRPSVYHQREQVNALMQDIATGKPSPTITVIDPNGRAHPFSEQPRGEQGTRPDAVATAAAHARRKDEQTPLGVQPGADDPKQGNNGPKI